jgi:ribosomal protein S24E
MLGKKILSTSSTPEIILNPLGIITLRGRSMNGNINALESEINEWIDKYLTNPAEVTYVDFCLEYFNKVNSKIIISLLKKIESLSLINKKYLISWYYEEGDEDILEKGEYFSSEVNIPFNFIEIYDALMPEYRFHEIETSA